MIQFSLAAKISLLVAALLLGFGLVMLSAFSVLSGRQIDRTIQADGATAGRQLSLYLTERAADLGRQAHAAANGQARVRMLFLQDDAATFREEIPWLTKELSSDAVLILNQDGKLMGRSPELSDIGPEAMAEIGKPLTTQKDGSAIVLADSKIYLVCCAPVLSDGYVKGEIALFERLGSAAAKAVSRQTGDQLAFTVAGKVVASSIGVNFSPPAVGAEPMQSTLLGIAYVSIAKRLPNADKVGFVALRPTRAITAPYEEARAAFVAVLMAALVLSLLGGVAFGRGLVRPIASLADAARVIERGDWPESFAASRNDEIGILQRSFNDMVVAAKDAQGRLLAMIDLDPLTELANHRKFRERLSQESRRCEVTGDLMAFALIDLDEFEKFNESCGHATGDETLVQIANALRRCLPEFAVVSRYGGDRFGALLPDSTAEELTALMINLRAWLESAGCPVTVSVGCCEYPKNSSREDGLVLAAELALTRAKQLGRNRVCSFDAVPGADQATDPFYLSQSLEDGSFATIQALAAAVDAKDAYTNGHSERVARYAADLSAACGDSADQVDRIFRCGTLHDVGKIGVPDSILKKPGRLDADEHKIMETHPVLGEMIAAKVPQLKELLPGVRHHHERWDGRGYPDALAGTQIPYIARVLAVADTYDAMTSDRPYRKGLSQEVALGEIEAQAGTQFDPRLAMTFVAMMRSRSVSRAA